MAYSPTYAAFSTSIHHCSALVSPATRPNPSFLKFRSNKSSRIELRCNSYGDSGGNGCTSVLDVFFLGKAIGEIARERIESSVGELVSAIGRLQTEQLKHISQFQDEVLEKARRAKVEATQGAQELVSEAASTVIEATQEAEALVTEAASTAKQATEGIVTEATSTLEEAAEGAHDIISEAASTAEQATGVAEELISDTASKVTDVSKTISSITGSVISDVSSSLLNPTKDDSFLGIFDKD